jgi:hypothetical protein
MADVIDENEEFRGRMSVEVEHLYERLADIEEQIRELRSILVARLEAHERYHDDNEHCWGLIKWCHLYPFRLAAVLTMLAVLAAPDVRGPLLTWLLQVLKGATW